MAGLGLVVLRAALALVLVARGTAAVFGTSPSDLGTPLGLVELIGGLFIGIGFFTRTTSIALIVTLLIVGWRANPGVMFLNWQGVPGPLEQSVVLFGALVCLALTGGGRWSVDGLRATTEESRAAGRARLRGKV